MKFIQTHIHEVASGIVFGLLLALMVFGATESNFKIFASTVETTEETQESEEANLTDYQLQKKELGEFGAKYQNSIKEAEEETKGRPSQVLIYTDREGNERWGGYVSGSRDWSNRDNLDYQAIKERETVTGILGHASARKNRAEQTMDRSIDRYNRTRLVSQYTRPIHVVSDRHFRLKTFANVSSRVTDPTEVDYSNYYSSAQRLQYPKNTYPVRSYERTQKPQKQDRKQLWEILLDHSKEKKKDKQF